MSPGDGENAKKVIRRVNTKANNPFFTVAQKLYIITKLPIIVLKQLQNE